jgi:hypothetical protein
MIFPMRVRAVIPFYDSSQASVQTHQSNHIPTKNPPPEGRGFSLVTYKAEI